MRLAKENLGKVSVTVEKAYHSIDKEYDKLVVVEEEGQFRTFISRKPVPIGTELTDREFWLPFSSVKESIVIDYNKFKQYIRTGEGLLDDSIIERHIKNKSVTGDKIAEGTITFVNIADNTITLNKINNEAIDTTLTKEGYLAEAKHTGDRLLNVEGLSVVKVTSTQSTVLDAWQIIDKKGNVHGVTINTYKDKSIDAIWLSINEDDQRPEDLEIKVDNPRYLNIIYNKADGTQQKVSIPLASFVTEAEFSKNGFKIINGVVTLKISSDITTSKYFHFDADGNITLNGFEERILEDLGTLDHSESEDGTMWGEFKKQEAIREQISNSAHQIFSDNWDKQDDDPEDYDPLAVVESTNAYNWKTTDTPASDGKTEGNLKDLYQNTLNQEEKLSGLEKKIYGVTTEIHKQINNHQTSGSTYIFNFVAKKGDVLDVELIDKEGCLNSDAIFNLNIDSISDSIYYPIGTNKITRINLVDSDITIGFFIWIGVAQWIKQGTVTLKINNLTNIPSLKIENLDKEISDNRNYTNNVYINSEGILVPNKDWFVSDYIKVPQYTYLYWNPNFIYVSAAIVGYDENKNVINYYTANSIERTDINSINFVYIRASFHKSVDKNAIIKIVKSMQTLWKVKYNRIYDNIDKLFLTNDILNNRVNNKVEKPLNITFNFSGNTHSSTIDTISCNIKAGEKFTVLLELLSGQIKENQLFVTYTDGINEQIGFLQTKGKNWYGTYVASKDIKTIGIFFAIVESGIANLSLGTLSFINKTKIDDIETKVFELHKDVIFVDKVISSPSSIYNFDLATPIKKGETIKILIKGYVTLKENETVLLYENNTSGANISVVSNKEVKYTTKTEVSSFALYVKNTAFKERGVVTLVINDINSDSEYSLNERDFVFSPSNVGQAHSSTLDRISLVLRQGYFTLLLSNKTTQNTGTTQLYVHYVGDESTTRIGMPVIGQPITLYADRMIDSIGFFMDANVNVTSGEMNVNIKDGLTISVSQLHKDSVTFAETLSTDIIAFHPEYEELPKFNALKGRINRSGNNILSLLFFSDMHMSNNIQLSRILKYADVYANYIDGIINGGDVVIDKFTDSFDWYYNTKGSEKVMFVIGNHDVNGASSWTQYSGKQAYDKYLAPAIDNWKVEQPDDAPLIGLCYYYKDYQDKQIRMIVLDLMSWNEEQNIWLTTCLSDAKSKNYHVVICSHFPGCAYDGFDCHYGTLLNNYSESGQEYNTNIDMSQAAKVINDFIVSGGVFVCWLVGHEHKDIIGKIRNYPNQLVIATDTSTCAYAGEDAPRNYYTKNQDAFSIIGIDTTNKLIKVFKVGRNIDYYLKEKHSICLSYKDKIIITES